MVEMRILENKLIKIMLIIIAAIGLNIAAINFVNFDIKGELKLQYTLKSEKIDTYQLFYNKSESVWNEENSIKMDYNTPNKEQTLTYTLPSDVQKIRIDLGNEPGEIQMSNITINYLWKTIDISSKILNSYDQYVGIISVGKIDKEIKIVRADTDPYIVIDVKNLDLPRLLNIDSYLNWLFKILVCIAVNILLFIFIKRAKDIKVLIKEIYGNKTLIWDLSKNDFKTRYAGSYLGIIWAFIQPVVTILVYWFVFQVGFKSQPVQDFPFVLWLVAGLVPWFFFSEALMNATNSMSEYSYLVKKVVFKISILPIVKIISALFVHMFFLGFTIVIFMAYGHNPTIYTLQVIYYSFCMFVLVLGMSYATCAIVIFFKDLGQIINIFLQVGMWMTPIMWSYDIMADKYQWILKLNPMYYIVEGYRDSLINQVWFWERFNQTIYFWLIAIGLFGIGVLIFKRLKIHFADVL